MRKKDMKRPFETDYAGAWRGHALTREGAVMAAMSHIVRDGYSRCTVTDKRNGQVVARLHINDDRRTVRVETVSPMKVTARPKLKLAA